MYVLSKYTEQRQQHECWRGRGRGRANGSYTQNWIWFMINSQWFMPFERTFFHGVQSLSRSKGQPQRNIKKNVKIAFRLLVLFNFDTLFKKWKKEYTEWTMEMLNLSLKLQLKRHCFAALEPQIRILFCERFLSFYVNRVLCSRLQPTLLVVYFFRLTFGKNGVYTIHAQQAPHSHLFMHINCLGQKFKNPLPTFAGTICRL